MSYLGIWDIDDLLTFPAITHRFDTGALTDADSSPSYRVYEDETGTAILTGSMAKLDDTNTTGFYSEQITLSAANGFEAGKCYTVYITAAVNSVTGGQHHTFQVGPVQADVRQFGGTAGTFSSGRPEVNSTLIDGSTSAATALRLLYAAVRTGTADSGTTTTMVDSARTEADTDYFKGDLIVFTSGNLLNQARLITAFDPTTDTVTFTPAVTQAVSAQTYIIVPWASIAAGEAMTLTSAYDFAKGTVAMTESYAAAGVAPTPVQAFFGLTQYNQNRAITGTDMKVKKLDGTTDAMTLGLDDATNPTSVERTA